MSATKPRVVVVQRRLTHYRVPFFSALRVELARRGVALDLLVGRGTDEEAAKKDSGTLDWARTVPTYYAGGGKLCWQRLQPYLRGADLVIVTQENKLLHNFPLLLNGRRSFKLAFWGHGANLQSGNPHGLKERFKRWTSRRVDWWFAYTEASTKLVEATGFPRERITTVNNAVDTVELMNHSRCITSDDVASLKRRCGFGDGPVGVFVGSLYPDRRLGFLFDAAREIRKQIPDFQLLIVGDGCEGEKLRVWCEQNPWAKWVGAQYGRQKAAYIALGQLMLNPGLVGLGVLDSFVCRVPLLTTACGQHGPEIAYLKHGENGFITDNDLASYAKAAVMLLRDGERLSSLQAGCAASAGEYTAENMVRRFSDGVAGALSLKRGRATP